MNHVFLEEWKSDKLLLFVALAIKPECSEEHEKAHEIFFQLFGREKKTKKDFIFLKIKLISTGGKI